MINKLNSPSDNESFKQSDEIDLRLFLNCFYRRKLIVGTFGLLFFILAVFYGLIKKKVWIGEFEIVLETNNSRFGSSLSGVVANLNLPVTTASTNTLNTQVSILESPSVLMPVFNFVKNKKSDSNLKFDDWKSQKLKVRLKPKTSVLNISYKDLDKDEIIPVLENISDQYQIYSGNKRRRNIDLSKNYLKKQIEIYQTKTKESIKKAEEFAIDKDLQINLAGGTNTNNSLPVNLIDFANRESSSQFSFNTASSIPDIGTASLISNVSIENERIRALNEIKNLDIQIKKIENLETDIKEIQYISLDMPESSVKDLVKDLDKLDAKLVELKSKYKKEDPLIKVVESKKEILVKLLKDRTLGLLKGKKIKAESLMESRTRPKGVILKYKDLIREASRAENILVNLENQLQIVTLEEAKVKDPWKLITTPTLKTFPLPPSRTAIAFYGFLIGITSGCILSIFKEKSSGIIFEESILKKISQTEVIDYISVKKNTLENYNKDILAKEILKYEEGRNIKLINAGLDELILDKILEIAFDNKSQIKFENDFSRFSKDDNLFLVTDVNSITFKEINSIMKRLKMLNQELVGIFLIKDT